MVPSDISGLQLWLKADQITGLNHGDLVSTWSDQSGNGFNAAQATNSIKPYYYTNQINGKPALYFDGARYLTCGDILDLEANSVTILAVVKASASSVARGIAGKHYAGANSGRYGLTQGATGTMRCIIDVGGAAYNAQYTDSNTDWRVILGVIDNSSLTNTVYEDWVSKAQISIPSYSGLDTTLVYGIGNYPNASPFIGYIAEVIQYNSALSSTQITALQSYINKKYYSAASPDAEQCMTGGM